MEDALTQSSGEVWHAVQTIACWLWTLESQCTCRVICRCCKSITGALSCYKPPWCASPSPAPWTPSVERNHRVMHQTRICQTIEALVFKLTWQMQKFPVKFQHPQSKLPCLVFRSSSAALQLLFCEPPEHIITSLIASNTVYSQYISTW